MSQVDDRRIARWYFGGTGAACASVITHPLDLVKVHMQTATKTKISFPGQFSKVYKNEGISGLYSGLSAALFRQCTYSMTRFGVCAEIKGYLDPNGTREFTFLELVGMAGFSGFLGGIVGTPADLINVRMQNDIKLPPNERRNYKHAFHGLYRVCKDEGARSLFSGTVFASVRAAVITTGQIAIYEEVKHFLLHVHNFEDGPITHFLSSLGAGGVATVITQPLDVLKTRQMNSKPGKQAGILNTLSSTAKLGPTAFFKGIVPAFVRTGPHTVLQFMVIEQLRMRFGYLPEYDTENKSINRLYLSPRQLLAFIDTTNV